MGKGVATSFEVKQKVLNAFRNGEKQSSIARRFEIGRYTVSRIISNYNERGHLTTLPKCGRPRKTTIHTDRLITRISQNDPFKSAPRIKAEIAGLNVSYRTIQRRLVAAKLFSRRPAKKPLISARNRAARLAFCRYHLNWTVDDWKKILFSDETRYTIFNSDGMRRVRRPVGQRFNPRFVTPTVKHGHGSVFLWGCFSWNSIGPIHFIQGIMDALVYRDILQDTMLPYAEWEMPLRFIFQHDNDPKHKSRVVTEWLAREQLRVLDWPSQSPDLNPIENLWEEVERRIRTEIFRNKQALVDKINEVWRNIPDDVIRKLISSMPRRCAKVIANNGYAINY